MKMTGTTRQSTHGKAYQSSQKAVEIIKTVVATTLTAPHGLIFERKTEQALSDASAFEMATKTNPSMSDGTTAHSPHPGFGDFAWTESGTADGLRAG